MNSVGNNLQDRIRIEVGIEWLSILSKNLQKERYEFAIKLKNDLTEVAYVLYIVYNIDIFFLTYFYCNVYIKQYWDWAPTYIALSYRLQALKIGAETFLTWCKVLPLAQWRSCLSLD